MILWNKLWLWSYTFLIYTSNTHVWIRQCYYKMYYYQMGWVCCKTSWSLICIEIDWKKYWSRFCIGLTNLNILNVRFQFPEISWISNQIHDMRPVLCSSTPILTYPSVPCHTPSVFTVRVKWDRSQRVHQHGNDPRIACCTTCSDLRVCLLRPSLFWDPWECLPA